MASVSSDFDSILIDFRSINFLELNGFNSCSRGNDIMVKYQECKIKDPRFDSSVQVYL